MDKIEDLKLWELYYFLEEKRIYKDEVVSDSYDEEDIYQELNRRYYEETKEDLSKDYEKRVKLYRWTQEKARYPLLNTLISSSLAQIYLEDEKYRPTDYFLITNVEPIFKFIGSELSRFFTANEYPKIILPKMNREKIHALVFEFLKEIDPTLTFVNRYREALNNGRLMDYHALPKEVKEQLKDNEDSNGNVNLTAYTNHGAHMVVSYTNTIEDFETIVHELFHYFYAEQHEQFPPYTLNEFYPIFYEMLSSSFLVHKGYPIEVIQTLKNQRTANTFALIKYFSPLFRYIKFFFELSGNITEKADIYSLNEGYKETVSNLTLDMQRQMHSHLPSFFDAKTFAHENCDNAIESLITNHKEWIKLYSYIIGDYLSFLGNNRAQKDFSIVEKINQCLLEGPSLDPYKVFKIVGCPTEEYDILPISDEIKKVIQKQKRAGLS